MTTAAEFQAKVDKSVVNMDRLDDIVNGDTTATVTTDNGTVPSMAKVIADFQTEADTVLEGYGDVTTAASQAATSATTATDKAAEAVDAAADAIATAGGLSAVSGNFLPQAPTGKKFSILGKYGRVAISMAEDGSIYIAKADVELFTTNLVAAVEAIFEKATLPDGYIGSTNVDGYALAFIDKYGRLPGGLLDDGTWRMRAAEFDILNGVAVSDILGGSGSGSGAVARGYFDSTYNHVIAYGQSRSCGSFAQPAISLTQPYDNVMFNGGVRAGISMSSFVPLVEADLSALGETPIAGMTKSIVDRILSVHGIAFDEHEYVLLGSCAGSGGLSIAQLSSGSSNFTDLCGQITAGRTVAHGLNKSIAPRAVTWSQGETDYSLSTSGATYYTALQTLLADINAHVASVYGAGRSMVMIMDQVNGHATYGHANDPYIALKQLEAARNLTGFYMACPTYIFPRSSGVHHTAAGSKWLGAYFGRAYEKICVRRETWEPLWPIATEYAGQAAYVTFNMPEGGKLEWDTTQYAAQLNKGFSAVNGSGVAHSITSVDIVSTDTVRIESASAFSPTHKVRFGFGDGGNLRDNTGDVFDPTGINKRTDNWSVIFEETLA